MFPQAALQASSLGGSGEHELFAFFENATIHLLKGITPFFNSINTGGEQLSLLWKGSAITAACCWFHPLELRLPIAKPDTVATL